MVAMAIKSIVSMDLWDDKLASFVILRGEGYCTYVSRIVLNVSYILSKSLTLIDCHGNIKDIFLKKKFFSKALRGNEDGTLQTCL